MTKTAGHIVVAVFLVLLVRTWLMLGVFQPLRIDGSSMAPAFYGPRYVLHCEECGNTFQCGCDAPQSRNFLTCPECGFAEITIDDAVKVDGDAIIVEKWSFLSRRPKRFEPVLFFSPETPGKLTLKRIVGLPGEKISFHAGSLSVNGKTVPRPPESYRDTTTCSSPGIWADESDSTRYRLTYCPKNVTPHFKLFHGALGTEKTESGVKFPACGKPEISDLGYNQMWLHSPEVLDLPRHWVLRFDISESNDLRIVISNDGGTAELNLTPPKKCTIIAAIVDARIVLILDGKIVTNMSQEDGGARTEKAPIVISCKKESPTNPLLKLENVKVFNPPNIHPNTVPEKEWVVPLDHYFVLGDNFPISQDSRTWSNPFIHKDKIVGKARK